MSSRWTNTVWLSFCSRVYLSFVFVFFSFSSFSFHSSSLFFFFGVCSDVQLQDASGHQNSSIGGAAMQVALPVGPDSTASTVTVTTRYKTEAYLATGALVITRYNISLAALTVGSAIYPALAPGVFSYNAIAPSSTVSPALCLVLVFVFGVVVFLLLLFHPLPFRLLVGLLVGLRVRLLFVSSCSSSSSSSSVFSSFITIIIIIIITSSRSSSSHGVVLWPAGDH